MVNDAEKFKADDEKQKERIAAKNGLESYCFSMKAKISEEEKKTINSKCDEALKWWRATSLARWTSSRTSRRSWRRSATPSSPNSTSKVEHQEAPCPTERLTECPTECPMECLVGCRKDQPVLDQTPVQQLKKSTRSMLLYISSLLRNSISAIEHKHVI